MTSEFTGPKDETAEQGNQSADGNRHGEIAVGTSRQATSAIVKWLAARSPREADRELASLARSHGVSFSVEREITFSKLGPNGERLPPREPRLLGVSVRGAWSEDLAKRAECFLTPAPQELIEQWLAELSVMVAKRADDDLSEELRLTAYAKRLQDYPADMVRHVLLGLRWKFWPTWFELADLLDKMNVERSMVVRRLSTPWAERRQEQAAEPSEPDPEARERTMKSAQELIAEMRKKLQERGEWPGAAE